MDVHDCKIVYVTTCINMKWLTKSNRCVFFCCFPGINYHATWTTMLSKNLSGKKCQEAKIYVGKITVLVKLKLCIDGYLSTYTIDGLYRISEAANSLSLIISNWTKISTLCFITWTLAEVSKKKISPVK